MPNKMLIDTTHPEETRVVVLRGNRVEEFDFESANRRQLRGNIYLAKVTRVEPSLQAAFVDYGGNRHGFLAFSEIHPDYYQIPVADRQALIADEERAHREAEEEVDRRASGGGRGRRPRREHSRRDPVRTQPLETSEDAHEASDAGHENGNPREAQGHEEGHENGNAREAEDHGAEASHEATAPTDTQHDTHANDVADDLGQAREAQAQPEQPAEPSQPDATEHHEEAPVASAAGETVEPVTAHEASPTTESPDLAPENGNHGEDSAGNGNITEIEEKAENGEEEAVESVGGADAMEEAQERAPPRYRRNYKIQEVIKRRQIMLVQVVKEERGTKGAALTTYLSLAGRYSVLMPNTARGGGISRKITNSVDRKKLKEIAQDLEVPEGMGVILRTAGASRTKTEVKRDFEYLLRLWETVRDFTLKSTAPMLVYEEGSLIKRSIRDLYNKDIEEILVAGEAGHREAKDFMRMLMPSHAKNVKLYVDPQPVFTRYGIESQLDAMFSSTVQLRSGGYIVLNQTEALVAIDVNSGPRDTRAPHRGYRAQDQPRSIRGSGPPASPARSRGADRHRLHRHGRRAQQSPRRAALEGKPEERPRAYPGRAHLAFRPDGDVAPAHPLERAGKLDRQMPALRRLRPCAFGVVGRAASVAHAGGNAAEGRDAQSARAHAHRGRALLSQPQARASARS